jgi:hypothetical protein
VTIFRLELTAHFIVSLGLAERDPPSLGTKQLCMRVLDRLVKILHSKKGVFFTPDENRCMAFLENLLRQQPVKSSADGLIYHKLIYFIFPWDKCSGF